LLLPGVDCEIHAVTADKDQDVISGKDQHHLNIATPAQKTLTITIILYTG